VTVKTGVVKNNGFNPVWEQCLALPFDCVGDMLDLIFVRFAVKQEDKDDEEPLAVYCTSLASLNSGQCHFAAISSAILTPFGRLSSSSLA
jgi:phosphatidylinositol phospholipase C, delta